MCRSPPFSRLNNGRRRVGHACSSVTCQRALGGFCPLAVVRDTAANTPYRDLSEPLLALLLGTHPDVGWPRHAVTAFGSGDSPDGFPWLLHRLTAPQPGTGFPFSPRLPQCVMLCVCTCACMRVHVCVCVRTCVGMRESDIKGRVSFVKCAFHKLTQLRGCPALYLL